MSASLRRRVATALATVTAIAALAAAQLAFAATSTSYSGTTSDGGSWVADVPSPWNGTLLLFSHGFGPPQAADAPDAATKQALLDRGYALAGSSYDPAGSWWALGSALRDQFETLSAVRADLQQAQGTPEGRARPALAMAFLNVPTWAPGQQMPASNDYAAQEQQQYDVQFTGPFTTMDFIESGRPWIEQAAGGNGSWTAGVDFARLLAHSPYAPEVRALYRAAGLQLGADLATLTASADIHADPGALQWLEQTSVPTGR